MDRDDVLKARLEEAVRLASFSGKPGFVGFLEDYQAGTALTVAARLNFSNLKLWGGFPDAERVFFGAFPDGMQPRAQAFPIIALTVRYRACDRLTHRDFLGALLHAGVDRSALGDILVEDGRCVFFLQKRGCGVFFDPH